MRFNEGQVQAYLDDGPHAGQTLTVDAHRDGSPPDHLEPSADTTYHLHRHDAELGAWVYRCATEPDGHHGDAGADLVVDRYDAEHWQAQMEVANDCGSDPVDRAPGLGESRTGR